MPNSSDWFRKTEWTPDDEQEFFARLKRSRSGKAQYLRIQALHLQDKHPQAAKKLLSKMLAEFPEDIQLANAYLQLAEIAWREGDEAAAIDAFRKSLQAQRDFRFVRTPVHRTFGLFAIEQNRTDLFDEVLLGLQEFTDVGHFPIEFYETLGIRAIIAHFRGDHRDAQRFAAEALTHAQKTESGFRYHKDLGLVDDKNSDFFRRVRAIAKLEV